MNLSNWPPYSPYCVQATGRGQSTCDRACLENFVDQYMDALIAHDPKKLPMTARVKNTEDGVRLNPGDGFWRTALAKGSYRLFVTDPEAGQVAFLGTMREVNTPMPNPVIIAIRLKVENRQVSEIENIVVRDAQAATNLEKWGTPNSVFLEAIPAAQRASRAELVRVANLYLSALEKNDGKEDPSLRRRLPAHSERRPDYEQSGRGRPDDSAAGSRARRAWRTRETAASGSAQTAGSADQHHGDGMRGAVQARATSTSSGVSATAASWRWTASAAWSW